MFATPKLTVCVPSRNRHYTFQETIRSLLVNLRMDVQFVFADNSDDASVMNAFMADVVHDPRVIFLPSADRALPMLDNWERCLEAATGDYICVIGDDDYIDVDVVDLIRKVELSRASIDVFVWSRLTYNWPDNRRMSSNISVPLATSVQEVDRKWLFDEFFSWIHHGATPICPFAIYHGAISRTIMDRMKQKFGGRYFEHPTVDFENTCKLLVTADTFFYAQRPFSVLGACAASNSATIGNAQALKDRNAEAVEELGRDFDHDPQLKTFPFPSFLGVSAAVAQCQHWFKTTYGYKIDGWEKNFADACAQNCAMSENRKSFDMCVAGYEAAFRQWKGGKYLKYFKPKWEKPAKIEHFTGVHEEVLLVDETIGSVQTPSDLYHLVEQMLAPIDDLNVKLLSRKMRAA